MHENLYLYIRWTWIYKYTDVQKSCKNVSTRYLFKITASLRMTPRSWYLSTRLHHMTTHSTAIFTIIALRKSYLIRFAYSFFLHFHSYRFFITTYQSFSQSRIIGRLNNFTVIALIHIFLSQRELFTDNVNKPHKISF